MGPPPYESMSDEALMTAYYECDNQAFDVLYKRHYPRLVALLRIKEAGKEAENLANETFLKVAMTKFEGEGQFDPSRGSFRAWLICIALNVLRKHWKEKGEKDENLREDDESVVDTQTKAEVVDTQTEAEADVSFEDSALTQNFSAATFDCLEGLPLNQWTVMVLDMVGMTTVQITEALKIPTGNVGTRIRLAREKMKKCLAAKGFHFVSPGSTPNGARFIMRIKPKGEGKKHPEEWLIWIPPPKEG